MKVKIPIKKKYEKIILNTSATRHVNRDRDFWIIESPTAFSLSRVISGLNEKDFNNLFKEIIVENGKKKRSRYLGDSITFEPKRDVTITFRVAKSELEIIKKAADEAKSDLSEFIRTTLLTRANKLLKHKHRRKIS